MNDTYITCQEENGSINISEEVISSVVRASVVEVEGVAGLANTAGSEIAELIGIKSLSRGVKVQFSEEKMIVDAIVNVSYGSNIIEVAKAVQEKIMSVVQFTTGIENAQVNVHVAGISFDK